MTSRIEAVQFDPGEWAKKDFTERVRIGTNIYVLEALGYPWAAYLFHALKLALFILGWMFFCSCTPGLGTLRNFASWIFAGAAFQKAFLWASLVEVAGFGCMSGPLGEAVAGSVIGWNFGEGHLADERLVEAVQAQCNFDEGELRVICVEAQPILGSTLHWRVVDAKRGILAEGEAELSDLAKRKPWDYGED